MGLGWGTLAGAFGKVIDLIVDPRKRLNRELASLEQERDFLLMQPSTEKNRSKLADVVQKIADKRRDIERLRD